MKIFYSLIQKMCEIKLLVSSCSGRVLMFHQIDEIQNWKHENLSITQESFEKLIISLQQKGYNFISLHDLETGIHLSSRNILLTFDDGFECIYKTVAKFLTDIKVPFAIFITVDLLNIPLYLNYEQLRELSANELCTIGAHSVSHPLLRKLNSTESKSEIKNSKSVIGEIIKKNVKYFAYPYGSIYAVSIRDIGYVKETGYKLGFSAINGYLTSNSLKMKWFLPRINVNELNHQKIFK
jgi:peptidoglycan/xylan/chitin deacetylase (PgdA/CDA1 family)